ncbi:MAG TPA: hypothetical protein VGG65_00115 [Thermoanaerobaculia bacterium]|jgi:hypothetical protein
MKILNARMHVVLDVALVVAFVLGPLVFGLGGSPALISFALALGFLLLAAVTWFRGRHEDASVSIPHGLIELAITIFLAFLPRLDGYSPGSPARRFFWIMAVAVGVVWLLTAYGRRSLDAQRKPVTAVPSQSASRG